MQYNLSFSNIKIYLTKSTKQNNKNTCEGVLCHVLILLFSCIFASAGHFHSLYQDSVQTLSNFFPTHCNKKKNCLPPLRFTEMIFSIGMSFIYFFFFSQSMMTGCFEGINTHMTTTESVSVSWKSDIISSVLIPMLSQKYGYPKYLAKGLIL